MSSQQGNSLKSMDHISIKWTKNLSMPDRPINNSTTLLNNSIAHNSLNHNHSSSTDPPSSSLGRANKMQVCRVDRI